MNVGILTYHDGINFGGFLQCFALQETIKHLGYNPIIINYKSKEHSIKEFKSLFFTKRPYIFFNNLKKYLKFKKSHKLLNLSNRISDVKLIDKENLTTIVVGSDELWNFKNDMFGYDGVYYGVGLEKFNLIGYAGCVGKITSNDKFPEEAVKSLTNFKYLSARDYNTQNIITKITNKECNLVVDPTFLYDFKEYIIKPNINNYIVFYGIYLSDEHISQIKKFAKEKNLKLISIGYYQSFVDESIIDINPFEWMGYIKNASYIVTNMFHGTVFSILLQKQFITFGSEIRSNKIISLVKQFSLDERVVMDENENIIDRLITPIDYDKVEKIKSEEVKKSYEFLKNALEKR